MNMINSKNIYTDRLDLRIPTMNEQYELWKILINNDVNKYYFPTPDRVFSKNNLSKNKLEDAKKARDIFIEELSNWEKQKPFYEKKIESINKQENDQKYTWSIFLKDSDIVIGQITCQPKDNEKENIRDIGWFINPKYQRKGYAYEAAYAVISFMFNEVKIKEIKTSAAQVNIASWKLMEKLGFKYMGTEESSYFDDNEFLISKIYYLNKKNFKS